MTQVSETRSPPGTRGSRPSGVAIAAIALALLLATLEVARWRATALTPTGTASEVDAFLRPQPERFYRVEWGGLALPDTLISGDLARALVTVRNVGDFTWPDAQMADPVKRNGGGAVRLAYRWWAANEDIVVHDYGSRTSLPWPIRSGEAVTVPLAIQVPDSAGAYRLEIDLVHELVAWFQNRGADRLMVRVLAQPRG